MGLRGLYFELLSILRSASKRGQQNVAVAAEIHQVTRPETRQAFPRTLPDAFDFGQVSLLKAREDERNLDRCSGALCANQSARDG